MSESQSRRFFIPPWLDELDIKAMPFRILCHLLRRAGEDGRCYPAAPSIAAACHCHVDTVWPHIKTLENAGIIRRLPKAFQGSNCYLITPPITGKIRAIDEPPITGNFPVPITGKNPVPITGNFPAGRNPLEESPLKKSNAIDDWFKDDGNASPKNGHDLFAYWNTIPELPKVKAISAKRKKELATRMKDQFFRDNWKDAIDKIRSLPFYLGENEKGWAATVDYFLKPDSVLKIMERKTSKPSTGQFGSKPQPRTVDTSKRPADVTYV